MAPRLMRRALLLAVIACVYAVAVTAAEDGEEAVVDDAVMSVDEQEVLIELGDTVDITFSVRGRLSQEVEVYLDVSPGDSEVVDLPGRVLLIPAGVEYTEYNLTVEGRHEGKVTLQPHANSSVDTSEAFVLLSVMKSPDYDTAAMVLGWISTVAWDISFLPQIWHNYRRHTVEGLSFDFLTYNLLGFSCYLMFNVGMFWIPAIQEQFELRNPHEILHVRLNDVIFPLYAVICTIVQIAQCLLYPKAEGQRVSLTCRVISGILVVLVIIGCILVPTVEDILWIDILYFMSYVKLFISTIKYCPQLYTNFKAKSTAGWSIWQVILDFSGGLMSIIQMFLLAANYDDYDSMLTDPTKLGLGLLSIFFNIFFMLQHYWLYRGNADPSKKALADAESTEQTKAQDEERF